MFDFKSKYEWQETPWETAKLEYGLVIGLILIAILAGISKADAALLTKEQKAIHAISEQCKQGQPNTYTACMVRSTLGQRLQWVPPVVLLPPVPEAKLKD